MDFISATTGFLNKQARPFRISVFAAALLWVVLGLNACSTTKNDWIHRSYHNITSYYNILFNGNEAYRKGLLQHEAAFHDDYTRILPYFRFGSDEATQASYAEMDRAIKKASKLIKQHSLKVKPELPKKKGALSKKEREFYKKSEYNKWVDEAYLLMANAYLYQKEYDKAAIAFQTVTRKFPETESEFLANMGLWRTYTEKEDFVQAEQFKNLCEANKKFKAEHTYDMAAYEANYYLKQQLYDDALKSLSKALELTKNKDRKARIYYILAQINLKSQKHGKAFNLFAEAAKKSTDYSLTFNARIQQAVAFENGSSGYESVIRELKKMVRDDKNIDYLDQLYHAMATVAMQAGQKAEARKYYQLCLQANGSDQNVKAQSYLALADIYFEEKKYELSGVYYDSTMVNLSEKHENYQAISAKASNLIVLAKSLGVIQLQDSLQRMATLSEAERDVIIARRISEVIAADNRLREIERNNANASNLMDRSQTTDPTSFGGKWYFYNSAAMSNGEAEFKRIWGSRPLADNWRRSNKNILENAPEDEQVVADEKAVTDPRNKEYYLQNLPKSEADFQASNQKIMDALLKAGHIYSDYIKDYQAAKTIFTELLTRFATTDAALEAYYQLYLLSQAQNNTGAAEAYKQELIRRFPDSNHAKALQDPNYLQRLRHSHIYVEKHYADAFQKYQDGAHTQALAELELALRDFPDNHLQAKLMLLSAMCQGKLGQLPKYSQGLQAVIDKFPSSDEAKLAAEMLKVAQSGRVGGQRISNDIYSMHPTEPLYAAYVLPTNRTAINALKFAFAAFNANYSNSVSYTVNEQQVGNIVLVYIKQNPNIADSRAYRKAVADDANLQALLGGVAEFDIDPSNLKTLIQDTDLALYRQFWQANY